MRIFRATDIVRVAGLIGASVRTCSFQFRLARYALPYKLHHLRCKLLEIRHPGYLKKIRKADIEPLFIVGAGRSGNTLLARLLHETGGVHFGPENFTLCRTYYEYLKCIDQPWEERVNIILDILAGQEDSWRWEKVDIAAVREYLLASDDHTLGNIIHAWYLHYGRAIGYPSERWGCKTPNLTPHIGNFIKVFPRARMIHIVRNPKDVVESFSRTDIKPYNRPSMAEVLWYFYNKALIEAQASRGVGIKTVQYANLAKNPQDTVRALADEIGLLPVEKKVQFNNPDTFGDHLKKINSPVRYYTYDSDRKIPAFLEDLYHEIIAE